MLVQTPDAEAGCEAISESSGGRSGSPRLGERLGPFVLTSVLGQGSTGRVYAARSEPHGYLAAIKVLDPELLLDRAAFELFRNEARAVRRISHPNIVKMSDVAVDRRHFYFVMELLVGQTLEHLLAQRGALGYRRAVQIAAQICDALAAAHAVGVIHRDLKPGNVFLSRNARKPDAVRLIDFGLAKMLGAGGVALGTGCVLGTPAYMSPEQTHGERVDHRSDIYAVGVLLYEMVTGQIPFDRPTLYELIDAQRHAEPPRPSDLPQLAETIPSRLEALILQCLAKDPLDRPVTMADVEIVLHQLG